MAAVYRAISLAFAYMTLSLVIFAAAAMSYVQPCPVETSQSSFLSESRRGVTTSANAGGMLLFRGGSPSSQFLRCVGVEHAALNPGRCKRRSGDVEWPSEAGSCGVSMLHADETGRWVKVRRRFTATDCVWGAVNDDHAAVNDEGLLASLDNAQAMAAGSSTAAGSPHYGRSQVRLESLVHDRAQRGFVQTLNAPVVLDNSNAILQSGVDTCGTLIERQHEASAVASYGVFCCQVQPAGPTVTAQDAAGEDSLGEIQTCCNALVASAVSARPRVVQWCMPDGICYTLDVPQVFAATPRARRNGRGDIRGLLQRLHQRRVRACLACPLAKVAGGVTLKDVPAFSCPSGFGEEGVKGRGGADIGGLGQRWRRTVKRVRETENEREGDWTGTGDCSGARGQVALWTAGQVKICVEVRCQEQASALLLVSEENAPGQRREAAGSADRISARVCPAGGIALHDPAPVSIHDCHCKSLSIDQCSKKRACHPTLYSAPHAIGRLALPSVCGGDRDGGEHAAWEGLGDGRQSESVHNEVALGGGSQTRFSWRFRRGLPARLDPRVVEATLAIACVEDARTVGTQKARRAAQRSMRADSGDEMAVHWRPRVCLPRFREVFGPAPRGDMI